MDIQDPNYQNRVQQIFEKASFLKNLGVKLRGCGPGWCESALEVQNYHTQQNRLVHAGVLATLADHTAGGAAGTLIKPEEMVLTVEFKVNFLRPARAKKLRCKSTILKAGRRFSIAESEVWAGDESSEVLVAKATVTLAIVETIPGG